MDYNICNKIFIVLQHSLINNLIFTKILLDIPTLYEILKTRYKTKYSKLKISQIYIVYEMNNSFDENKN